MSAPTYPSSTPTSPTTTEDSSILEDNPTMIPVIAGVAGGFVVILLLIACCCAFCCRKKRRKEMDYINNRQKVKLNDYDIDKVVDIEVGTVNESYQAVDEEGLKKINNKRKDLKKVIGKKKNKEMKDLKIDSHRLTTGRTIGEGNFGVVYEGVLADQEGNYQCDVAVKEISGDAITDKELTDFVEEVMRMRNFSHPNVLTAIGIIVEGNMPKVIMPKMDNGDLRSYVADKNNKITGREVLNFSHQVAKGMEYLASKGFVHRDLAARNCMVDKVLTCKVADFGLSRDLFDADYYKAESKIPLPIRWMAIESICATKFSVKSDVWSFGILLWELYTRGAKPYTGLDNATVVAYVKNGNRMKKPPTSPDEMYDLMTRCWVKQPANRPTFSSIVEFIDMFQGGKNDGADEDEDEADYENFQIEKEDS